MFMGFMYGLMYGFLWNSNHPNMVGMNVYDIADLR